MAGIPKQGTDDGLLPSSAAVLDFICLFTHDLKRKQKRWQDGALKYHTFNKRIMVYDDRGHFIGDAHWQAETHLESGDEFQLDRGAAIVQVSDCTGQTEQDLTELLDKRARDVERRRANATSRTSRSSLHASTSPAQNQSSHFQPRHRPLTDIVGVPSRIGRAVISPHSPYEARQMAQKAEQDEDSRSPKRRKKEESPPAKSHHARSLFGATLTLTSMTSSHPPRSHTPRDKPNVELKALLGDRDTEEQPHISLSKHTDALIQRSIALEKFTTPHTSALPQTLDYSAKAPDDVCKLSKGGMGRDDQAEEPVVPVDETATRKPSPKHTVAQVPKKHLPRKQPIPECSVPVDSSPIVEEPQPIEPILTDKEDAKKAARVTKLVTDNELSRPEQGPRTELRIKSRKKRGLLMISEKRAPETNRRKESKIAAEKGLEFSGNLESKELVPATQNLDFPLCQPQTSNIPPKKTCEEDEITIVAVTPPGSPRDLGVSNELVDPEIGDESTSSNSPKALPNRISRLQGGNDATESVQIPLVKMADEKPTAIGRRTRKKVVQCASSDEELQDAESTSHFKDAHDSRNTKSSVPRITKMARKSVKSREIIGFPVPNIEPVPPPPAAIQAAIGVDTRQHSPSAQVGGAKSWVENPKTRKPLAESTSASSVSLRVSSCDTDVIPPTRSIPRISNPATRGRKATKKEDAAGQLPQTMVQFDPVVTPRVGAPKPPSTRTTSTLPGFTNANGGAWSKHAEDLLGMTRPKNKSSRHY